MTPTMQEIAEKASVSTMTVSRALRGTGALRPETQLRVLAAAESLGYRANAAARAMATGRFNAVALLLDSEFGRDHLPPNLLYGVQAALERQQMQLTLAHMTDDQLTSDERVPMILKQIMADGLLINYKMGVPPKLTELITRHRIPSIWIESNRTTDCVCFDHIEGARRATEYLLAMGHRRVAFVDNHHDTPATDEPGRHHFSLADRRTGYRQAMSEAGFEPWLIHMGDRTPAASDRVAWSRTWLSKPASQRPTAVLTYVPATGLPVLWAALSLGLRVPEDLSLMTFGGRHEANGLPLTRMYLPEYEIGLAAVEMLLQKIERPRRPIPTRRLSISLEPGQTCAPPLP